MESEQEQSSCEFTKDMKEQTLERMDFGGGLNAGLHMEPVEKAFDRLARVRETPVSKASLSGCLGGSPSATDECLADPIYPSTGPPNRLYRPEGKTGTFNILQHLPGNGQIVVRRFANKKELRVRQRAIAFVRDHMQFHP